MAPPYLLRDAHVRGDVLVLVVEAEAYLSHAVVASAILGVRVFVQGLPRRLHGETGHFFYDGVAHDHVAVRPDLAAG